MDKKPLVSIVTPSYNQHEFLEETILSVLDQDYPALEYYVIDGGSIDGSIEIIKKYEKKLTGWISEPDQGQTEAINKGFARCSGEVMAWLNSDDVYQPGAIRSAVEFLENNPEIGLVYGDTDLIDGSGRKIGRFNAQQTSYQRLMRGGVYIPQPAAFWRRDVWEKSGPLDPSFYFAMDYDLWVRFSKITTIEYTPQLWASFRIHLEGKTTTSEDRCWPEMRIVHKREGGRMISVFMGKYLLRQLFGRLWNKIKFRSFESHGENYG
jgi:glycosyltransferase involved in cell wall biosynthesis